MAYGFTQVAMLLVPQAGPAVQLLNGIRLGLFF
jgi:hypothetical protein